MRRSLSKVAAIFFIIAVSVQAGAQSSVIDLNPLNADLGTLFTEIGRDINPRIHQIALTGNDLVGEARLRGLARIYLAVPGVSATLFDGLGGGVLNTEDPDLWKFSLVSIPGLIESSVGAEGSVSDIYSMATGKAMALPAVRLGLGFPLPGGTELLLNGFYLPAALFDFGLSFAGAEIADMVNAIEPRLDMLTVGGIFRKTILSDKHGFFRPSLSIGASYVYSHFGFSLGNFSLEALGVEVGPDQTGGLGSLSMEGDLSFSTTVHSLGAVLHLSKTILWTLTPFAKFGAYYHLNRYSSNFAVTAVLTPEDDPATLKDESLDVIEQALSAPVELSSEDVSFIVSGGLEIKFLPVTVSACLSLDLERPIVSIDALELNGFTVNGLSATLSARFQI